MIRIPQRQVYAYLFENVDTLLLSLYKAPAGGVDQFMLLDTMWQGMAVSQMCAFIRVWLRAVFKLL